MWNWRWLFQMGRRAASLGQQGERAAARYLQQQRFRILGRNVRTKLGELDIIAREGETLVFVEVKTRRQGDPTEAVDSRKQQHVSRAATAWLKSRRLMDARVRYDVVAVVWGDGDQPSEIRHYRAAFEAC